MCYLNNNTQRTLCDQIKTAATASVHNTGNRYYNVYASTWCEIAELDNDVELLDAAASVHSRH